jgi:HEAT repeat protein
MKPTRLAVWTAGGLLALLGAIGAGSDATWAECNTYRPPPPPTPPTADPNAGVPGLTPGRETDPPPPGGTPGPTTPGGDVGGPTTGGRPGGRPGGGNGATTNGGGGVEAGHWTHWWYANRVLLLESGARAHNHAARTGRELTSPEDALWRADARGALAAALSDDDDEVVAAAVLALGKAGDGADIGLVRAIAVDEGRGAAEREHATMALGLLRADTEQDARDARRSLEAIAEDSESSGRLRALALYALGLRGDEAAVPFLADRARKPDRAWDAPAAGLSALGLTGCEAAQIELRRVLAEARGARQSMRRAYAAHGLAKLGDTASVPLLLGLLKDDEKEVRRAAALALAALAPPAHEDSVKALRKQLEKDDDRGARAMAAVALGSLGGDAALSALRRAYGGDDAGLRPFAAVAIGVAARDAERPRLAQPLLRDLKRGTRAELLGATCVAVGLAGLDEAVPALREIVNEAGDPDVVAQAAISLGLIGDRGAGRDRLRELLQSAHDPMLRGEIALALGLMGDVGAIAVLEKTVTEGGAEHERVSACLALGRIGGPDSARVLVSVLADEKRSRLERHMAGNGLGMLLDTSEGRRVGRIAADLNWYVLTPTVIDILSEM